MFSLELECAPEEQDLLIAELWEQGCEGVVELSEERVRAFFGVGADGAELAERFRRFHPVWREEEQRDWVAYARERLQPMAVGERFFLAPEWRDDPAPEGRFRIVVNPGLAFGTGVHETTQLCLEALERWVRPGAAVLDVGTGSGILALAARLLGAERAWGCDVDEVALAIARGNAPQAAFFVGSVDAVKSASADLVVANISPEAIAALAPDLMRALRPGGVLLASGFERGEEPLVRETLGGGVAHFKGNWALLEWTKGKRADGYTGAMGMVGG